MSDPPPTKPKPGSLRDRIAAFENKPAVPSGPAPVPRPKPAGGASWKPRALSPPPSPQPGSTSASSPHTPEKKIVGGMSASDAKESIGMGGSLKDRMAALQGRGAFGGLGGAPTAPPKPATEKPKWKPPPVVSPPSDDEETTYTNDTHVSAKSPPVPITEQAHDDISAKPDEHTPATEGEEDGGEANPEEEERQRRAAIAARMARLGGARVGMAPPIFGKKPSVNREETPKEEEALSVENKAQRSPDDQTAISPPTVATPEANSSSGDSLDTTVQRKNSASSSLLTVDSASQPAKSPASMPVPSAPRRAAPPRKKVMRSPSPAPPPIVLAEEPKEQSPVTVAEGETVVSPDTNTPETHEGGDRQEEIGEVGKSVGAEELEDSAPEVTKLPPAPVLMMSEGHMVLESPGAMKATEDEQHKPAAEFKTLEPEIDTKDSYYAPPAVEEEGQVLADTESIATSPPPSIAVTEDDEGEHTSSDEETALAPAELTEEEEEIARRERVAEKLSKMGGINPLAPPPQVSPPSPPPEDDEELETQDTPVSEVIERQLAISVPPLPTTAPARRPSVESAVPANESVPLPPVSPASRKASIDVPEDVSEENDHHQDAASLSEEARARARKAGDEMGMKDEEGAYAEGVANEPAEHQEEEQEEMEEMAPARITRAPPPPPNMSTRPPPPEVMRRVSQGSKRASLPPPPRGALSVLEPEADREYGAPPTRRIPPPPMHDDDQMVSPVELAYTRQDYGEPEQEEAPLPPPRSMPPPPRQRSIDLPLQTYIPPAPNSPPSRRTSVAPPIPGTFSLADADLPVRTSTSPAPTSLPSKRTSVVPPIPGAFSPPPRLERPTSPPAPPARLALSRNQSLDQEILDEEEGDPIDPGFHSPCRTPPPSHTQPLPVPSPPPPVPRRVLESEGELVQEDPETSRRRTIAERMAKLGGIKFGAPPPMGRPSPTAPSAEESVPQEAELSTQEPQSEEVDLDEEEERARKQRIATRMASMGGVGMFGAPQRVPPPVRARREESEDTATAVQPPPPPQRAVPPPRPPPPPQQLDMDFELETHSTSDDGVKVEAEDSELEELHREDTVEQAAPPPVPSRGNRRASGVSIESVPRRATQSPPPLPGGRPSVPTSAANRRSSLRKSSADSYTTSSTRMASMDVSRASAPVVPSQSDYVMVEEPEESPPSPPARPNRGPPSRPPPAPAPENATSEWEMPSDPTALALDGPQLDLSLSVSSLSEDSTSYPSPVASHPPPPAATNQDLAEEPPRRPLMQVPTEMSVDDLMAMWGRVGVQICEIATTLFEKSKRSLIGDGSYLGFIRAVFSQVPNAVMPSGGAEFGYLIYAQTGTAVQRRASDIMPGDVVVLYEAKLKGHKGLQTYHQHVGATGEPLLGIVSDFEVKKSKVKVFHANQHVGQQTVESVSYRLEDLKSGTVKIFRVLEA